MMKYVMGLWMMLWLGVAGYGASLSPEEAALKINNVATNRVVKIASECRVIYQPEESWGYSHHAAVQFFKGKLYATFSNGRQNEDDCGQRIMISSSEDFENWSNSEPLVDSVMGDHSLLVLVNGGLYVHDGVLTAYYGSYEYLPGSLRGENLRPIKDVSRVKHAMWIVQTTDGITWTEPRKIDAPFSCNHGPIALQSGRLILGGGTVYPYTDDPAGVNSYSVGVIDDRRAVSRGAKLITEGSFFQTDDGVVYMMLRTNTDYLWCSESRDNGETWSEPNPTRFTDDHSKFMFGRLADGRYYYVGNPVPGSGRTPLNLSVSHDGVNFNTEYIVRDEPYAKRLEGLHKGGLYGYPGTLIHDEHLYIIYSKRKETVEITRVKLVDF